MPSRKYQLEQHFLRSPRLALMLIGHSNIKKRDTVLEIGAGSGVITSALSKRCHKVIALEPDHETAEKLRKNLRTAENVEIIERSFADFDLKTLPEGYKVFSNPPFSHSSEIVHAFLESDNPPASFYLILQKQFALKLLNTDRHYTSKLGLALARKYATRIRYPLRPHDFTPPPAVPTVLFEATSLRLDTVSHSPSPNSDQTHSS